MRHFSVTCAKEGCKNEVETFQKSLCSTCAKDFYRDLSPVELKKVSHEVKEKNEAVATSIFPEKETGLGVLFPEWTQRSSMKDERVLLTSCLHYLYHSRNDNLLCNRILRRNELQLIEVKVK